MKLLFNILFIFIVGFSAFAVSGKEYIEKVRANYENIESIHLIMNYKLFRGHEGKELVQEFESLFYKNGKQTYRKINEIEIVSSNKVEININHTDKYITLTKGKEISPIDVNVDASLKFCENVLISSKNKNTLVTLVIKDKVDLPYTKLVIEIDKNYWIQEIAMYYNSKINFSESYFEQDYDFPKLVVEYRDFKKKIKNKNEMLKIEDVISFSKKDTKASLNDNYKNYQLVDLRNIK